MNIKNIIVITTLAILSTGCFEEEAEIEVVNPQSLEECIPINNANKRDKCKMEVSVYLSKKSAVLKKKTLGSPDF